MCLMSLRSSCAIHRQYVDNVLRQISPLRRLFVALAHRCLVLLQCLSQWIKYGIIGGGATAGNRAEYREVVVVLLKHVAKALEQRPAVR